MTSIAANIATLTEQLQPFACQLIAVTKTKPADALLEAYRAGCRQFGENKVQEMVEKYEVLPKDIQWHLIGHLQTNKVKYIAPFVHLIHSVDSLKLLREIDKQARKNQRSIDCLLQVHIAEEETKFGLSYAEAEELMRSDELAGLHHIRIMGLMGMATFTEDPAQIRQEFRQLKAFFDRMQRNEYAPQVQLRELSMGMSGDYLIAAEEGSTMVRVGSLIFGARG